MNGTEKVVKHLEMIQGVIKRLGLNSFFVKGGSLLLVITSQVLFAIYIFFTFHKQNYLMREGFFCPCRSSGAYFSHYRILDPGWILPLVSTTIPIPLRCNKETRRHGF